MLHSLAQLACGRILSSATSFSGSVTGGVLWLARVAGQSRTSVVVRLRLGKERAESSGCLLCC